MFTQSKGLLKWDETILSFKPERSFQNTITLGSASGNFNYERLVDEIDKKLGFLEESNDLEINIKGWNDKLVLDLLKLALSSQTILK